MSTTPVQPLRILHVEDNALDADLVAMTLRDVWPACTIQRVGSESELHHALRQGTFDVVLSDFSMPGFNGIDALQLVRDRWPQTPFIFVSGTIGEEKAVDALKHGAADYVVKDHLTRLIPAIQRALETMRALAERQLLEEKLVRAQRLESIGMLAGGIAHDLNNMLAPIVMGIDLVRQKTGDPGILRVLDMMELSAGQGGALIKQVLTFARGIKGERHALEVRRVVRDVANLLRETLPRSIVIEQQVEGEPWPIESDVTELSQVLMNLCINARDAMPEGGCLTMTIANTQVGAAEAAKHAGVRKGNYVMIAVADNGTGMPKEVVERIFDPFFTTKPPGKGTGLGLPTVRAIVSNHGGFTTVVSTPGEGTCFRLHFPAEVNATPLSRAPTPAPIPVGHGETILVVDDEYSVRELIRGLLEACGYRALTAADGLAALGMLRRHPGAVPLVITDLMMPGLSCEEFVAALRAINPEAKIILTSGSTEPEDARVAKTLGCEEFLPKPADAETLLGAVSRVLATKNPA